MSFTDELPDCDDFEVIEFKAKEMIVDKINYRITIWCLRHHIKDTSYQLFDLFNKECKLMKSNLDEISQIIQGIKPPINDETFQQQTETSSDFDSSSSSTEYSPELKIIIAATAPLWIPLIIGGTIVSLPVAIGSVIKDTIVEKMKIKQYQENKLEHMLKLGEEELKDYTTDAIYNALHGTYLRKLMSGLEEVCEHIIPKQIKEDKELIKNMMEEDRDYKTLKLEYAPIEQKIKEIIGNLLYVKIKHLSDRQPLISIERSIIGRGLFSQIHLCDVDIGGNNERCAVRKLTSSIQSDTYFQLSLAENMM